LCPWPVEPSASKADIKASVVMRENLHGPRCAYDRYTVACECRNGEIL
jgi:hypothetical protein